MNANRRAARSQADEREQHIAQVTGKIAYVRSVDLELGEKLLFDLFQAMAGLASLSSEHV
jgi:hypothetical protein